jgi:hypothetical protein
MITISLQRFGAALSLMSDRFSAVVIRGEFKVHFSKFRKAFTQAEKKKLLHNLREIFHSRLHTFGAK